MYKYTINVRENRWANQELTNQRYCQHWVHKIQDKDQKKKTKQTKHTHTNNTENKTDIHVKLG